MQNFILVAGAETRRTFAKDEERKYPGDALYKNTALQSGTLCQHVQLPVACATILHFTFFTSHNIQCCIGMQP